MKLFTIYTKNHSNRNKLNKNSKYNICNAINSLKTNIEDQVNEISVYPKVGKPHLNLVSDI